MKISEIIYMGLVIGLVIGAILFANKLWNFGTSGDDFDKVCIGGHEYYVASFTQKAMAALIVDDSGKPIKCE